MDSTIISSGDRGGVMDKDVVIANTVPQWDAMRKKLGIDDATNTKLSELHGPLGAMDWTREQVVFARSTDRPTGGFSLSILRLQMEAQDGWKIDLQIIPPKKDLMVMQMITKPYLVFRMRKVEGKPKLILHEPETH